MLFFIFLRFLSPGSGILLSLGAGRRRQARHLPYHPLIFRKIYLEKEMPFAKRRKCNNYEYQ
jgi:hypothetical protein